MRFNSLPFPFRRTALAVLIAVFGFGMNAPATAEAAELTPVQNFGENPGALKMFSYVPEGLPEGAPVVVAMHGCTQNGSDYFNNSGWKKFADQWKFAVVVPEQTQQNNAQNCFNWFEPGDSDRGQGEAESIRQMVRYTHDNHGTDANRTYVEGLSAGAAMAANLLADYPDVFAGGAINAGMPAKCARSLPEANMCMTTDQGKTPQQWGDLVRQSSDHSGPWPRVAIWQGTGDSTVAPVNATQLRDQWTDVHGIPQEPTNTEQLPAGTTKHTYGDGQGNALVQEYLIDGMEHGKAVDPGSEGAQCGTAGQYYPDTICSTYYTARFWGLNP